MNFLFYLAKNNWRRFVLTGYQHEIFLERLKRLRRKKKVSQVELAGVLNVSRGAVGHWESGCRIPDVSTIAKIASFLDCSPAYLLGFTEVQENYLSSPIFDMMFNSDVPMFIYIYDKNEAPHFLWVNDANLRILGYNLAEFLDLNPISLSEKIYANKLDEKSKILNHKRSLETGWIHVCKDGTRLPVNQFIHKIKTPKQTYYFTINYYISPI